MRRSIGAAVSLAVLILGCWSPPAQKKSALDELPAEPLPRPSKDGGVLSPDDGDGDDTAVEASGDELAPASAAPTSCTFTVDPAADPGVLRGNGTVLPACASAGAFDQAAYERQLGIYTGPGPAQAACSPADIARLEGNLADRTGTWATYRQGLSPSCEACVFSKTKDDRWGPIVLVSGDPEERGFVNWGSCQAIVNTSAECGRAYLYDQFCLNDTCALCGGDYYPICLNAALGPGGKCRATRDAMLARCPSLGSSLSICGRTIVETAKIVCGGC